MILTKILRGMSLGTTLRLPLGNRVDVMDVSRLKKKKNFNFNILIIFQPFEE